MIPTTSGICALIIAILLIVNDRNSKLSSKFSTFTGKLHIGKDASERLFSTIKGFLLILCLVVIFATLVYYFG